MTLPNFLVIGAQKSGTSAIHKALAHHPQIFMSSPKEPWFFALQGTSALYGGPYGALYNQLYNYDMTTYQALFANAGEAHARGESSTAYLMADCAEIAADNIHREIPDVKIIAILRQPAERAYSAFCHLRQLKREPEQEFGRALLAESSAARADWPPDIGYRRNGEYAKLLAPYLARFDREQIRIYLHDDYLARPQAMLQEIFAWLGVDPVVQPEMLKRVHETRQNRSSTLDQMLRTRTPLRKAVGGLLPERWRKGLLNTLWNANRFKFPPLSAEMRQSLTEEYRPDILQLQEMLDRDLSHWLAPSP